MRQLRRRDRLFRRAQRRYRREIRRIAEYEADGDYANAQDLEQEGLIVLWEHCDRPPARAPLMADVRERMRRYLQRHILRNASAAPGEARDVGVSRGQA